MLPELRSRFDEFESLRRQVEQETLSLSDAQRDWKPSPDVWSHREIVEHLVLSDEIVGRPARRAEPEPWPLRIAPRALRRALVAAAFRRDVALPLPRSTLEPQGRAPVAELLDRWRRSREAMRADLESLEIVRLRYAHPVLGPLTAAQMLALGVLHAEYHARQAAALLERASFP